MKIGMIGAAGISQAAARLFRRAGAEVVLSNSRGPASLKALVETLGPGVSAGTVADAVAADIVFLGIPWRSTAEFLPTLPPMDGRILIDATNAFASYAPDFRRAELGGRTSSEIIADLVPSAKIVKAFNTLPARFIEEPPLGSGKRVLFISGDHQDANLAVASLIDGAGFEPVVLGGLTEGGRMQQLDGPLSGLRLLKES